MYMSGVIDYVDIYNDFIDAYLKRRGVWSQYQARDIQIPRPLSSVAFCCDMDRTHLVDACKSKSGEAELTGCSDQASDHTKEALSFVRTARTTPPHISC